MNVVKLTLIQPNLSRVEMGQKVIYFSYETPIAYYDYIEGCTYLSENIWTRTTGRHLARIRQDNPQYEVVTRDEFIARLIDYS